MKSVAVVGFYHPTLPYLKQSEAEEVWVPNHGFMIMNASGDVPRCTRLFEIHKEAWFRRKELPSHERYWEWLQQDHGFPIYLQEAVPAIPRGVVYPFESVCADVFACLWRRYGDGRLIRDKYLTSSASFMLALAIHEGFERVELYGIGMETQTEYNYQRPGFEFMIGVACGRGIDVINMEETPVCRADVYAYEAIPYITAERLLALRDVYKEMEQAQHVQAQAVVDAFNRGEEKDLALAQAASDLKAAHTGACAMVEALIDQGSQYLSRQALEIHKRQYVLDADTFKAETNALGGRVQDLMARGKRKQAEAAWNRYRDARASMHANTGAVQVLDNLIRECDLERVRHQIVLTVQDV